MQVLTKPVQEQARRNKEAIAAAGHAGRKADQLGTANGNSSSAAQAQRLSSSPQASLNTDTQHRLAKASLSARCDAPEAEDSPANHRSSAGRYAEDKQLSTQQTAVAAYGSANGPSPVHNGQPQENGVSPSRDKRSREESAAEHSSKALRPSMDATCSPQSSLRLPEGSTAGAGHPSRPEGSQEGSAALAARLLGNSWLGDMKGRFDEAIGRGAKEQGVRPFPTANNCNSSLLTSMMTTGQQLYNTVCLLYQTLLPSCLPG